MGCWFRLGVRGACPLVFVIILIIIMGYCVVIFRCGQYSWSHIGPLCSAVFIPIHGYKAFQVLNNTIYSVWSHNFYGSPKVLSVQVVINATFNAMLNVSWTYDTKVGLIFLLYFLNWSTQINYLHSNEVRIVFKKYETIHESGCW